MRGGFQPTEWLDDGRRCVASRLCVGRRWPGRNARTTVVGEQRKLNTGRLVRLGGSLAFPREPFGSAGAAPSQGEPFGSAGASPSQGEPFGSAGAATYGRDVDSARRCPKAVAILRTAFYVEPFLLICFGFLLRVSPPLLEGGSKPSLADTVVCVLSVRGGYVLRL